MAGRSVRREGGNAATAVLGVAVVAILVVAGIVDIGIFFIVRARAQTAADAAALAAAAELIPGSTSDPAAQARRFASANGARLVHCHCRRGLRAAEVEVAMTARFFMVYESARKDIPARARAGIDLAAVGRGRSGSLGSSGSS